MADLSTFFGTKKIKNPLIIGSCGLTGTIDSIEKFAKSGVGAIVLKSIFEEQINEEIKFTDNENSYGESLNYLQTYIKSNNIASYLDLIKASKDKVDIPVFASINCSSGEEWLYFAENIAKAGADGIQLNLFISPTDGTLSSSEIEAKYLEIIRNVSKEIKIPIIVKLSQFFTGLAHFAKQITEYDIAGLTLFNRFFDPDIDLENMKMMSTNIFSNDTSYFLPLKWVGVLYNQISKDLYASTGVLDGQIAIKMLLAGAKALEMVSIIYKKGPNSVEPILEYIDTWLEEEHYDSLQKIIGKLSMPQQDNYTAYEKMQFMKYFSSK